MSTEKVLDFHPNAAENFRERGQRLLASMKPLQQEDRREQFKADRHAAFTFTEKDIVSIGPRHTFDPVTMEVSEIAFAVGNRLLGLAKEECEEIEKLSEAIQRAPGFRHRVSFKFVRNALLDWLQARAEGSTVQDLSSYILEQSRLAVQVFEVWVPLANLAVEREVRLGPVRIRPISREMLDSWFESARKNKTPEELVLMDPSLAKERAKVQGLAAAYIALRAERQFAVDKAIERAEEVAAFFRLFHPANSHPRAAFYCRTLGRENVESYSVFVIKDDTFVGRTASMIAPYPDIWELSNERLAYLQQGFASIQEFLAADPRSEFQQEVIDAILLYSRSTMIREPVDKLVFIFSALESILLKNETEPIQTHISDRLAFLLGVSVEERKKIVRLVRTCYGFRSKFLHHGRSLEDFSALGEFMKYTWVFFIRLTKYAHQHKTRTDFIEEIETRKYSGP